MLLLEGLDGPTPQDAVTPEIQRNFAEVIKLMRLHNDLAEGSPLPPAEPTSRLESFWGPKREPKMMVGLPRSELADSVLDQVENLVSGREDSLKSGRSSKLLPPPLQRQRRFYVPSEDPILPKQVNPELARLTPGVSLQQLLSENLWFSQQEALALESTAMAAFQAVSWLDLWSLTISKVAAGSGSSALEDDASFRRLCQSGGRAISYLAHQTANLWANLVLRRRDAVLTRVTKGAGREAALGLRNGPIRSSPALFPGEMVDAAVERRRTDDSDRLVHQAVTKVSGQPRTTAAKPKSLASASSAAKTAAPSKPRGKTLPASTSGKGGRNQPSSQPSSSRGGSGKKSKKGGKR